MKILARLLAAALCCSSLAVAAPAGDTKKAKAYLAEVKKHLLESYIEREKMKDADLVAAALKGFSAAMDHKDFAAVDADTRTVIKEALKDKSLDSIDKAIDVIESADSKIDFIKLADKAAAEMVKVTGDPFSRILTGEDFNKLTKMLGGAAKEDSIGASIGAKDGKVTVGYVQFGYAAWDEGVEMGDEVLEVNGKAVKGLPNDELAELIKLKAGEKLTMSIKREGFDEPFLFTIRQKKTKPKDVLFVMLGDGVGYLRTTIFDNNLQKEVKKGLQAMKDQGMTKLIFDLRNNPGGALPAATGVADLFLPQNLTITDVKMFYKPSVGGIQIPGMGGDQTYTTKTKSDFEEMPMEILINHASASASELLAGALQDHKRGRLVGETTYGKGVGQTPIPLMSMPGSGGGLGLPDRFLYLTVLRYYLPSGRSINHTGVTPTVEFKEKKPAHDAFLALWKIRTSGAIEKYLDDRWAANVDLFKKLAEKDGFDAAKYPDFDKLFKGLKTTLSQDDVRAEVRRSIRRRLTLVDDVQFVCDLETDAQLQYALVELLDGKK